MEEFERVDDSDGSLQHQKRVAVKLHMKSELKLKIMLGSSGRRVRRADGNKKVYGPGISDLFSAFSNYLNKRTKWLRFSYPSHCRRYQRDGLPRRTSSLLAISLSQPSEPSSPLARTSSHTPAERGISAPSLRYVLGITQGHMRFCTN